MPPFKVLRLLRESTKAPQARDSWEKTEAKRLGLLDKSGRLTKEGNLALEEFRHVRPQVDRAARDIVRASIGRDLSEVKFLRCGMAIGYAIDKGWLTLEDEDLCVTDLGATMVMANVTHIKDTWN